MKVTVELDEMTARRVCDYIFGDEGPSEEQVAASLLRLAHRYSGWPELLDNRHKAAMTIVRAQAAEHAARAGLTSHSTAATEADRLLDFMLR